ncbi:hypothetical protein AVEN_82384-1 [Araneus ventricosus]|uniref:Uncharacterized protein n=1 Tax=Araneus ventricosus TaxID=182803 RepID=A0A4Y2HIW2_ARAVE|nr:hypothetical protein AVEN_82384-1 [Araneus ventricosus]
MARSRLRRRIVPGSKPDSTEDLLCMWTCYALNHTYWFKRPPVGVVQKFGEGVPDQVSSSSSDHGSKLRGPSQNGPLVASKRGVNTNKLNSCGFIVIRESKSENTRSPDGFSLCMAAFSKLIRPLWK